MLSASPTDSGNSDELRFKIELGRSPLVAATRDLWTHDQLAQLFPEYMFYVYSAMKTSVSLLRVAHGRARELAPKDTVAALIAPYFEEHIEEEKEHAVWLLEDITHLGIDEREIVQRTPPASVVNLIGTQYYWTLHVHPVCLLAYLAVIEGNPAPREFIERHAAPVNLPHRALRTLLLHADIDLVHGRHLFELIDTLPLTRDHSRLMGLNALQALQQLSEVFREIVARHQDVTRH